MIKILPSPDTSTMVLQVKGKTTKEDAGKIDEYIEQRFDEDRKINVLAFVSYLEGVTIKSIVSGIKVDLKRWKQYQKVALVSDKKWMEEAGKTADLFPGIEVHAFSKGEIKEAWSWLLK